MTARFAKARAALRAGLGAGLCAGLAAGLPLLGWAPDAQAQLTARPQISRQCVYNGDCAEGLVCAGGYCRAECASDRDCPAERTCIAGWFDGQGGLLHMAQANEAVPAGGGAAPGHPGERFARRCLARAAQSAGAVGGQSPAPVIAPAFHAVDAGLTATAREMRDKCPASVSFTGWITASGPGVATYRVVRSDGANGPVKALKFEAAGEQQFKETWTLGASLRGALTLEVLTPNRLTVAPTTFSLECL